MEFVESVFYDVLFWIMLLVFDLDFYVISEKVMIEELILFDVVEREVIEVDMSKDVVVYVIFWSDYWVG